MFDFLSIGKTLKSFGAELVSIRSSIELTLCEIEDTQYAPPCLEDVVSSLEAWAANNEKKYLSYLAPILSGLASNVGLVSNEAAFSGHLKIRNVLPTEDVHTQISRDVQMCGLLGKDRFIELMRPHLNALDWSHAGLLLRDRPIAIEKLESKLKKLRARELELISSAEKVGIAID